MPNPTSSAANLTGPFAETVQPTAAARPAGPNGIERTMSTGSSSAGSSTARSSSAGSSQVEDLELSSIRFNWQLKALLPVVFVLLAGLLLFLVATVSLRDPVRHTVLIGAGAVAVAICAVLIVALAYVIQRPMVELQEKIAQVSDGNLDVAVSFSRRHDEIADARPKRQRACVRRHL